MSLNPQITLNSLGLQKWLDDFEETLNEAGVLSLPKTVLAFLKICSHPLSGHQPNN